MSYPSIYSSYAGKGFSWDDENEPCGRLLTQAEYLERLKIRSDIFRIDKDSFLKKTEAFCLSIALVVGLWLPTMKIASIAIGPDFLDPMALERIDVGKVEIMNELLDIREDATPKTVQRPEKMRPYKRKQNAVAHSDGNRGSGGGDYRERIVKRGVLGLVSGVVSGKTIYGDIFAKGGFAEQIDAILLGTQGLKKGGTDNTGRRGEAGIGFGRGNKSGFGDDPGGVENLIDGLMTADHYVLEPKRTPRAKLITPIRTGGGNIYGGRSRREIMRVVQQNIGALRYAYNRRLREKPGLKGKICVRFAIDEFGKVIFCEVIESTMSDKYFETMVVSKIKRWAFDKIDKPGDVTEVMYPFVFSL